MAIQAGRGPHAHSVLNASPGHSAKIAETVAQSSPTQGGGLQRNGSQASFKRSQSTAMIEHKSKSLHYNYRKSQMDKIEAENFKLAQKLFNLKSDLGKKGFEQDFNKHNFYKSNIQKIKKRSIPNHDGRAGLLPPIEDSRKHFDEINEALDAEHDVKFKSKASNRGANNSVRSRRGSKPPSAEKSARDKSEIVQRLVQEIDNEHATGDKTGGPVEVVQK